MKLRKIKCLTAMSIAILALSLTACGTSNEKPVEETKVESQVEVSEESIEEVIEESSSSEEEIEEASVEDEVVDDKTTSETKEEIEVSDEIVEENVTSDSTYVNFDEMNFYLNGKKYTLGETTLGELIDDGVEFKEESMNEFDNIVNKNTSTSGFKIPLEQYWSAQVMVLNNTDSPLPARDCVIYEVYLPNKPEKTQDIIAFDFPLDMTMEDLVANAGEPTEQKHFQNEGEEYWTETLKYTKESDKYLIPNTYHFEFSNKGLTYITIEALK